MPHRFLQIALTPSVLAEQQRLDGGARGPRPASLHERHSFDRFTQSEADFIAARDSFYLSTVSETGWLRSRLEDSGE